MQFKVNGMRKRNDQHLLESLDSGSWGSHFYDHFGNSNLAIVELNAQELDIASMPHATFL